MYVAPTLLCEKLWKNGTPEPMTCVSVDGPEVSYTTLDEPTFWTFKSKKSETVAVPSLALTSMVILPTSPLEGVPLNVRVALSNDNHAGSGVPPGICAV